MSRLKEVGEFPALPALPLAQALEKKLDCTRSREEGCVLLGTCGKTLGEWLAGRRKAVMFNKADEILCNLGLNWWEVWTPENSGEHYERVEYAFTGGDTLEQLAFGEEDRIEDQQWSAPVPLTREEAIARAVYLRRKDPTAFSWRTLSVVMAEYHGFVRSERFWWGALVPTGLVERGTARNGKVVPWLEASA